MSNDNINHPKHYTNTPFGLEVIDITEHYNFCIGNALKYIMRAGLKCEKGMTQEEKMMEDLGRPCGISTGKCRNRKSYPTNTTKS